jgi:RNA polymerase sigma factor (sigma-70 family)
LRTVGDTTKLAIQAVMGPGLDSSILARTALYDRVLTRIHRYFTRMVHDPSEAEECVQRTLVELERSLRAGTYDPDRSFNGWMWLKARTVWAGWCRERETRRRLLDSAEEREAARAGRPGHELPGDLASIEQKMDAEALLAAVRRRLGDETFRAFIHYYGGEKTLSDVAHMLGRDRKTIARRISEAHLLIDRLLGKSERN